MNQWAAVRRERLFHLHYPVVPNALKAELLPLSHEAPDLVASSTEKQGCSSCQHPADCWPGHLGVWEIWRNTGRSHLANLHDPWTMFGCCGPGLASSLSCLSSASGFSLPISSSATSAARRLLLQGPRTAFVHSLRTWGKPAASLCGCGAGAMVKSRGDVVPPGA